MIETKVVIIGGGPAGLAAAIQLQRYGIPSILLEKERLGGLLWSANLVENYPGFPAGVHGPKLAQLIERQARRIGVPIVRECVLRVAILGDEITALVKTEGQFALRTPVSFGGNFLRVANPGSEMITNQSALRTPVGFGGDLPEADNDTAGGTDVAAPRKPDAQEQSTLRSATISDGNLPEADNDTAGGTDVAAPRKPDAQEQSTLRSATISDGNLPEEGYGAAGGMIAATPDKPSQKSQFIVQTNEHEYRAAYVLVASGTKPRPLPFPIPPECAPNVHSDVGPLLRESGKQIVIVGAGDAAFDYALNLTKNRNCVTILNRGRNVKCLGLLWERARANPAIVYRAECPVSGVEAGETAGRLRIRCEAGESLEADALLFAIGRVPQVDFLSTELFTRVHPGLYFVGDVKNGLYRQAAIAAGDGLGAAMAIYFSLEA